MAIPKFEQLFTPILEICQDNQIHKMTDLIDELAIKVGVSDEEKMLLLPSGKGFVFKNRVWWARTFLVKAELLVTNIRGTVEITDLGKKVVSENKIVTVETLKQFDHFEKNWGEGKEKNSDTSEQKIGVGLITAEPLTPEEMIENGYKVMKEELAGELLETIKKNITPAGFEQLVVDLLLAMGYGGSRKDAGIAVGKSGDGGIDGLINEDRLGLNKIYIQAKHWEANVGDVELGRFLGSLASKGATKGVMITTSDFTQQAKNTITNNRSSVEIVLINGKLLAELMIEYNLGVSPVATYEVKRLDSDYFI